jgi:hypothetical protein
MLGLAADILEQNVIDIPVTLESLQTRVASPSLCAVKDLLD